MGNRKRLKPSSRPTEKSDLFDDLPDDLVICILRKLSSSASRPSDLVNILFTCKRMYCLCLNPLVLSEAGAKTFAIKANNWSDSAHRFLKRCVNAGNIEATYTLGMIRFYCLQNRQSGASLMAKAAIKSHGPSLYSLAVIQFNGSGGSKDDKDLRAGVALCARATFLGHIDALRELGHCLQDGYGVPQNVSGGRRFLLQANARELASSFNSMLTSRPSRKHPLGHANHACLSMANIDITGCPLLSELGCNVPAREVHPANQFLRDWFLSGRGTLGQGLRLCSHSGCGRPETRPHEFRRCSVCGTVNYCSRACQALDWKLRHRLQCVQQIEQWHDGAGEHDGDNEIGEIAEIEGADDVAIPE
uniref:MYND-type domain-containing protein n=1 Tax=Rhizophora mucronata TaxID=61149 RepID=A0A2P2QN35_RHIMU